MDLWSWKPPNRWYICWVLPFPMLPGSFSIPFSDMPKLFSAASASLTGTVILFGPRDGQESEWIRHQHISTGSPRGFLWHFSNIYHYHVIIYSESTAFATVALSSNRIQVAGTKGVFQSQGCADGGERTGDLLRNCQPCSDLLQLGPVVRLPGCGAVAGAAGGALQAIFNAENHGKSSLQLRYIHNYG